jgi:hypothetical protein
VVKTQVAPGRDRNGLLSKERQHARADHDGGGRPAFASKMICTLLITSQPIADTLYRSTLSLTGCALRPRPHCAIRNGCF